MAHWLSDDNCHLTLRLPRGSPASSDLWVNTKKQDRRQPECRTVHNLEMGIAINVDSLSHCQLNFIGTWQVVAQPLLALSIMPSHMSDALICGKSGANVKLGAEFCCVLGGIQKTHCHSSHLFSFLDGCDATGAEDWSSHPNLWQKSFLLDVFLFALTLPAKLCTNFGMSIYTRPWSGHRSHPVPVPVDRTVVIQSWNVWTFGFCSPESVAL